MSAATIAHRDTLSANLSALHQWRAAWRDIFRTLRDIGHCYNRRIIV
jgi:hypothetical protein